ncbi:MAG: acetyl-CoA carboxylase biotin carboxyl carrier protein [Gammaproteobacteria bacterium]
MDIRKVKKLIELLEESGIAEIEIKEGEESVRISRQGTAVAATPVPAPLMAEPAAAAPVPVAQEPAAPEVEDNSNAITSPMVGTFYLSSSPGAAPFASVGQSVKKGDVICIIEAMKIMNQIESDRDGVVKSIPGSEGKPVEFGQPLFIIE